MAFTDPRLPGAGARVFLPSEKAGPLLADAGFSAGDFAHWDARRIALGLPDGSRDIEVEKGTALESGFDELHGVSFKKGCFIGQELTARMKYRGLAKKRLVPLIVTEGPTPAAGTLLLTPEGKEAGVVRSAVEGHAMALVPDRTSQGAIDRGGGRLESGLARLGELAHAQGSHGRIKPRDILNPCRYPVF